jgi:hypothetical protein
MPYSVPMAIAASRLDDEHAAGLAREAAPAKAARR